MDDLRWNHIGQSIKYLESLANSKISVLGLSDRANRDISKQIEKLNSILDTWKYLLLKFNNQPPGYSQPANLRVEMAGTFSDFSGTLFEIKSAASSTIEKGIFRFRLVQAVLIGVSVLLTAVAAVTIFRYEREWKDLPRCQSCHTGDAVSHLSGAGLVPDASGIRLTQAYRTGDNSASALLATNKRFAEQDNTLYRFSKGHGGVRCENCHGSTHAEWPIADDTANDNAAAKTLQGYSGKIIECTVCHAQGSLQLTTNGPHGLHNVNDSGWLDESHGQFYTQNKPGCKACHGLDLLGTPLAKMPTARTFRVEGSTIAYAQGALVRCDRCHSRPSL